MALLHIRTWILRKKKCFDLADADTLPIITEWRLSTQFLFLYDNSLHFSQSGTVFGVCTWLPEKEYSKLCSKTSSVDIVGYL